MSPEWSGSVIAPGRPSRRSECNAGVINPAGRATPMTTTAGPWTAGPCVLPLSGSLLAKDPDAHIKSRGDWTWVGGCRRGACPGPCAFVAPAHNIGLPHARCGVSLSGLSAMWTDCAER
eukprot:16430462-Heterocapsa_arctica.AAC.1